MIRAHINLLQPEAAFPLQTTARSAVQPQKKREQTYQPCTHGMAQKQQHCETEGNIKLNGTFSQWPLLKIEVKQLW